MRRLRDETSSQDPPVARAAQLLASARPLDVRPPGLPAAPSTRPALVWSVRAAVALAATFGTFAAAASTMGPWHLWRPAPASDVAAAATGDGTGARAMAAAPRPARSAEAPVELSAPEIAAVDLPAPLAAVAVGSTRTGSKGTRPSAVAAPPAADAPPPADDESTLVLRAVRALRREGDPAHAQALAEKALATYPRGAQSEEASALVMEAAAARGDTAVAHRAARAYLDRFRAGRFVDRAQRILVSAAPSPSR